MKKLEDELRISGGAGSQHIFAKYIFDVAEQIGPNQIERAGGFVRGFQAMANHKVSFPDGAHPLSDFVFSVLETKVMERRRVPKDIEAFVCLTRQAHAHIDAYFTKTQHQHSDAKEPCFVFV